MSKNRKSSLEQEINSGHRQKTQPGDKDAEDHRRGRITLGRVGWMFTKDILKDGANRSRQKLSSSVGSCMSQTQSKKKSLLVHYDAENQVELDQFVSDYSPNRKSECLSSIINRISITSFSLVRFQSSSRDFMNNSVSLSVILIFQFLDFVTCNGTVTIIFLQ